MWHWEKIKLILYKIFAILIGVVIIFGTMLGEPESEQYNQEEIIWEKCNSVVGDPDTYPIDIVIQCKQLLRRTTNAFVGD